METSPTVTSDVAEPCVYTTCRDLATRNVRYDGRIFPLCDEHIKPRYHPADVHHKLPGALRRAVRVATERVRNYGGRA